MSLKRTRRQSGATLIEVLVTVVVLGVGLLGLAGLQATTLRSGYSAHLRSQATWLANDIIDRMRANRQAALAGDYDLAAFPGSLCNPALVATGSRAAQDLAEWRNALGCGLPNGTGRIERVNNAFSVLIRWTDARGNIKDGAGASDAGSQADLQTFVYQTDL